MFGQLALDGAVVLPLPEFAVLLEELDDGVVVLELLSAANAIADPPPMRAPASPTASALRLSHLNVITSSRSRVPVAA